MLLLLVGFVIWIPAGTAGVRSWRGGGTPALVGPGLVLRFPGLQRVERFPEGIVSATGTVAAPSREGTTIDLPYTVGVRPRPADLLTLSGETAGDARGALTALVDSALREYSAATGTQELAIGAARDRLESRLSERLRERFPGAEIQVRLGTPDVPAAVRASFAREAVYGRRVDTGLRVLFVGIDGADWDVIDPLLRAGQLPQLARLRREGVWARLRSSVPTLSPLLWTTVATGKSPDRHGINDFLVLDTTTGEYNRPFLTPALDLIPGYGRLQGIVYRTGDRRFEGRTANDAVTAAIASRAGTGLSPSRARKDHASTPKTAAASAVQTRSRDRSHTKTDIARTTHTGATLFQCSIARCIPLRSNTTGRNSKTRIVT